MTDSDDEIPSQNYWPSVADLFLTLFIIAIALVAVVFCALLPTNNVGKDQALVHAVGNDLRHVREPMNRLRPSLGLPQIESTVQPSAVITKLSETCDTAVKQIDDLKSKIAELQGESVRLKGENEGLQGVNERLKGENDKPPILVVDATQVSFQKGKAEILPVNAKTLRRDVFTELLAIVKKYESVDTIEIIGHTDWSPVGGNSNLDSQLLNALESDQLGELSAGSNADLGLMRAIAVKQEWDNWHKNQLPREIQVRCYSAAQGINPPAINGIIHAKRARRIEIRFTQLN